MAVAVAVAGEQPEESPRELTAADVLRLVDGEQIPGIDPSDPDVQAVQAGLSTQAARKAFARAQSEGFLQLEMGYGLFPDARDVEQLTRVWGIWCAKRGQPPMTLTMAADGTGSLHCDLDAVWQTWTVAGFGVLGRLLETKRSQAHARWTFTTTALTVDGLEAGDAVAMARSVVWVLTRRGE